MTEQTEYLVKFKAECIVVGSVLADDWEQLVETSPHNWGSEMEIEDIRDIDLIDLLHWEICSE